MKIRIALAQMKVVPGQIQENLETVLRFLEIAKKNKIDLLVLPEFCLSGYLVGDLWEEDDFLHELQDSGEILREKSSEGTGILFGNVGIDFSKRGRDGRALKYNAAFCAWNGSWVQNERIHENFFPKTLLPDYREFEESRHFSDLQRLAYSMKVEVEELIHPIELDLASKYITEKNSKIKVGVSLCEDAWDENNSVSVISCLKNKGAELQINLSASPFTLGKNSKRFRVFGQHAKNIQTPILYANCIGTQNNGKTIYAFDGASSIHMPNGKVKGELCSREEKMGFLSYDSTFPNKIELEQGFSIPKLHENTSLEILRNLQFSLKETAQMFGLKKFVIGASGGIDSAVNAALHVSVFGAQNVFLVNMPSRYNSKKTKGLAEKLAENLEVPYATVSIEDSVALTKSQIHGLEMKSSTGQVKVLELSEFALENVQARDRSSRILAAISSAVGGAFSCNANKAEITVGYSTLYGDHGGYLAALGDLWKEQVYDLGKTLNEFEFQKEMIPQEVFEILPSAELSEAQSLDVGQGDPLIYSYHDRLFASWMQNWQRLTPTDILEHYLFGDLEKVLGLPKSIKAYFTDSSKFIADLERWWKLFRGMGVAKRVQSPPILAISRRVYGYDYRESLMKPRFSPKYFELKQKILNL